MSDDFTAAVRAMRDLNTAGVLRMRLPNNFTVSQATKDAFGEALSVPLDTLYGKSVPAADQPGYAGTDLARKTPWMALPATEIPVTDEMHAVGLAEYELCQDVTTIYRAMRPLEPTTTIMVVTEDVQGQRNAAWERIAYLEAVVANMPTADSVKEMLDSKDAEIALLRQALAMKDARIGELKSVLASTPVAFEDPDAKPEPEINPFRNFGHDPRRMGPF